MGVPEVSDNERKHRKIIAALIDSLHQHKIDAEEGTGFDPEARTLVLDCVEPYKERTTDPATCYLAKVAVSHGGKLATYRDEPPKMLDRYDAHLLRNGFWVAVATSTNPLTLKQETRLVIHYGAAKQKEAQA